MTKKLFSVLAITALLFVQSQNARADFVPDLTGGNSYDTGGKAGFVNFLTYDNSGGGNWITALGLAPGDVTSVDETLTGSETNVFFYQVLRNDGKLGSFDSTQSFEIPAGFNDWVKSGLLQGKVFNDAEGAVVGGSGNNNEFNGPVSTNTAFTAGSTTSAAVWGINPSTDRGQANWNLNTFLGSSVSDIFILVSDATFLSPTVPTSTGFDQIAFANTIGDAIAAVPVPNPEPGSLALLAGGMFGLGFVRRRRTSRAPRGLPTGK